MANLSPAQEQTEPETLGKPKPKVALNEGQRAPAAGEAAESSKTEPVRNTAPSGDFDDTFREKR